jgi:hypothetical protein
LTLIITAPTTDIVAIQHDRTWMTGSRGRVGRSKTVKMSIDN